MRPWRAGPLVVLRRGLRRTVSSSAIRARSACVAASPPALPKSPPAGRPPAVHVAARNPRPSILPTIFPEWLREPKDRPAETLPRPARPAPPLLSVRPVIWYLPKCLTTGAEELLGEGGRLMNEVFKALADPTRRRILQLLRGGERSAGELAEEFDVSRPSVSHHFRGAPAGGPDPLPPRGTEHLLLAQHDRGRGPPGGHLGPVLRFARRQGDDTHEALAARIPRPDRRGGGRFPVRLPGAVRPAARPGAGSLGPPRQAGRLGGQGERRLGPGDRSGLHGRVHRAGTAPALAVAPAVRRRAASGRPTSTSWPWWWPCSARSTRRS